MKLTSLDRTLLLFTALLASYQVSEGIEGLATLPVTAYTIGFGILLIAALLIFILGFEVLDLPIVFILSTIIPLSLSLGLVWDHLASFRTAFLIFTIIGFLAVTFTRAIPMQNKIPVVVLAVTHGISGLTIFLLPIFIAIQGDMKAPFAFVGIGGGLIGVGGLLLSFLRLGSPILSRERIMRLFPLLLLLTTACFVAGFVWG